jgi:hypothetical protein
MLSLGRDRVAEIAVDALTLCCDAATLAAPIEEPKPPTPPPPPPSPPPSPPPQKQESKTGKRAPPPPPKRADTKPQPAAVMLPSQQEAKEAAKDAPAGGEQHFQFHVGSKSLIQVLDPFNSVVIGRDCAFYMHLTHGRLAPARHTFLDERSQ